MASDHGILKGEALKRVQGKALPSPIRSTDCD